MFFNFNQNNSGGYFVEDLDKGVCEEIIIEADSVEAAVDKLYRIGSDVDGFHNYCSCCGERWNDWIDDDEGTEEPEIYGEPVGRVKAGPFSEKAFVHYADGSFKLFTHKERD